MPFYRAQGAFPGHFLEPVAGRAPGQGGHGDGPVPGEPRQTGDREKNLQYLFSRQWSDLKAHCNEKGILVMGDLPLYMTHDSADVWTRPGLFDLYSRGDPRAVAGVPPAIPPGTQLWGNPLYRWDVHKAQGFDRWLARMAQAAGRFDLVRIDHFRGFSAYWEVDAGEKTAASGKWRPWPGR